MLQVTLLLAAAALIISKKNKLHQETMILFELLASNADPLKATSHLLGLFYWKREGVCNTQVSFQISCMQACMRIITYKHTLKPKRKSSTVAL